VRALAAFAAAMAFAGAAAAQQGAGFVRVRDGRFEVDGARFRFLGANAAVMHGPVHRAALERTLDAVAADGLKVVRVWALGERPAGDDVWTRDFAFRVGPEGWVEESFVHLDRVLDAARRRGLRVVVVLANRWGDYGGAPQYLGWAGVRGAGGELLRGDAALTRFFEEETAQALYRAHVARVVTRVSTVSGAAYRDDPTVMSWELINESDIAARRRDVLLRWTQDTARFLRARDPSHLIAAGHIGYTQQSQRETWRALQALPEVDYADAHAYPTTLRGVRAPADLDDFVDDHAQLARNVLRKPFVWGEFGFSTNERVHRGAARAQWFERFLARSEEDDVDGALAWIYTPSADPPREHGLYVDAPAAQRTADLRALLRRHASRWGAAGSVTNPRLDAARGDAPLWSTWRTVTGPGARGASPARSREGLRWVISPERYAQARAENLGRWDGFAVWHVYGNGAASFTYRLLVPPSLRALAARAVRVRVRARVSSELPGRGEGATAEDASRVRVSLDGVVVGEVTTALDDGAGRWVEVATEEVAALRAGAAHTLRFEVPAGPLANGLCLYGGATGREAVPSDSGALPGRVDVLLSVR
jgi:mannan endo-1,4-beta-mannosidase